VNNDRNWTILFIGGASGVGKSNIAYELARFYMVNVIEVDDIQQAIKASTTIDKFPAIHHWSTGINWIDIGVLGNVDWLINVSKEIIPGLKSIVNNHLESNIPVIMEGDFIYPEFTVSFNNQNHCCPVKKSK
jgi:2-phosphoglycerate kinase